MPKRTDLKSILIIGAGPIVIGQACEFDYSGAQACKALRQEGYKVILVNSNPATIMTDPEMADVTYIEPITWQMVEKIIAKEKPDAILPTMGGQTALNCALDLHKHGVLAKHGVEMIGASEKAIEKAEDRLKFKDAMTSIGLDSAKSGIAHSMDEAWTVQKRITAEIGGTGFPMVIRPSFTLGGTGGGIAYNPEEFEEICRRGIDLSPTNELLIEESLIGWKEFEMEVVRDKADNCIIVCSIENLDPMGIHTGDSITVAPAQTLTDKEYQLMRNASIAILREIGVDTGGSNVQFATNPADGRMVVIEMNPRVSRSSALASKATGFPIAKIAAKLAVGYTLDELRNDITGGATPASFEPSIDYVVTKIPRFAFEKFREADPHLTTQMKSVGEVMAIGRTFQESFQKALRGLETGIDGLAERNEVHEGDREQIVEAIGNAGPERILFVADAFRNGMRLEEIHDETAIDPWFLAQIEQIVGTERQLGGRSLASLSTAEMRHLKQMGFADRRLAKLLGTNQHEVRKVRHTMGVRPVYKRVDTCAAEFATQTAYLYSSYDEECEAEPTTRRKIMVLGGGPNRIGQGIEFDYCCVHAALAMREDGYETIMVNCNPETVSTDYDTSDRLYFEPVTLEDVLEIVDKEKPTGVIVQFGGQTPLKLALELERAGVPIIGTSPDSIDIAEDRERFQKTAARTEAQAATQPHRAHRRRRAAAGARDRLPAGGAAELRARWPRDGDRARRQRSAALHARGGAGEREVAGAARPFSRRCDRGRRRCGVRRQRGDDRRHHGARRAGRRPLGRLGVFAATVFAAIAATGRAAPPDHPDGQGAQGRRADERAIRDPGRGEQPRRSRGLRAGSQPARVAHGAVRQQGHRAAAGQDRGALHGRAAPERPARPQWTGTGRGDPAVLQHQGSGVPVQQVPGCRPDPRPRDALHRRSDGRRPQLRRGDAQEPTGRRLAPARQGHRGDQREERRQGPRRQGGQRAGRSRLPDRGHQGHGRRDRVRRHRVTVVNKVKDGRPHIADKVKAGEVQLVYTTVDETRTAIADSRHIRTAAIANRVTYYTTMAGCEAATEALKHQDDLTVTSLQELHAELH